MGKKKKSSDEKTLARILLITAIAQLIAAVFDVVEHFLQ